MNSISSVSHASAGYSQSSRSSVNPVANDWKNLNLALGQGNLNQARSAFTSLQANLASSPTGSPAPNSTVGKALSQLQSSLQSGDLSGARTDFAAFKVAVRGGDQHGQAVAGGVTSYNAAPVESTPSSDGYSPVGTRFSAFA
jgi:hypothetical protein